MWKDYDEKKFHGGIPISAKCEYSWIAHELCFHQIYELTFNRKMTNSKLVKRDFQ